jgi:hypothetical protein
MGETEGAEGCIVHVSGNLFCRLAQVVKQQRDVSVLCNNM